MRFARSVLVAALLMTSASAFAAGSVTFTQATAMLATPALGSAYVTITSPQDDTLTGLASPCCDAVELHSMTMQNDTMQMRQLDHLDLKAGVPAVIGEQAGRMESRHLMLIGIHQPMKAGQTFPITLQFATQGKQSARFTVVERGAKTTAGDPHAASH